MLRIALAGIGYIAEEYIKLFCSGKIRGATITALSSRNLIHMQKISQKYQLVDTVLFTDYDKMLASDRLDAVIICTPHLYHPSMAILSIERGIHTLIEKPIGIYPTEISALMECVELHPEVTTGVLYCRRTGAAFQKLKTMLAKDAIGSIKRITWINTNMYRAQVYFDSHPWKGTYNGEGGGLLMTQVSHQIDLLVWLLGLPQTIHASCYVGKERNISVENEVVLMMEYQKGGIGQFIASSRESPGTDRLEIIGGRGQVILENNSSLIYRSLEKNEIIFAHTTQDIYGKIPYNEEHFLFYDNDNTIIQAEIINDFLEAVVSGSETICPVREAVTTQYFIQAAYLSEWTQQKIKFPPDTRLYQKELIRRMQKGVK